MTPEPADLRMTLHRAADVLRGAGTVVVAGHVNPDGDALGSVFALTAALRHLGVKAVPSWGSRDADEPPPVLEPALGFLPCAEDARAPDDLPAAPDVVVACDTAAASRLGTLAPLAEAASTVIVIDHHAVGDGFGDIRLVDEYASCTGVLVLALIDALDVPLGAAMADALYLALLTATGRFAFASTTPTDHRVAARLLEAGADHVAVTRAVYESASRGYLALVARVADRAVVADDLVVSWVTRTDLVQTGTGEEETDGLIDLLRKVEGIDVTCLLRETPQGTWRTSLRSRGACDVAAVAAGLGGGGHRMAAGFTGRGTVESVLADIRVRLAEAGG
ncbi:MAG TPA: DHH family phosphoesterase [Euzebya sp.]|nr:DHH family phosphoesterase [Euzebya sp.]